MKSLLTVFAFFFLVGWLISFFKLQHGMASHLLLLMSVILVMGRLRYQGESKDKSSTV